MQNARFVDPPNMEESLRRSRREHNLVITGTFNRDVAIREEDLIFFAPGNDPWTDAILKNSFESDRGRCCGIGRKFLALRIAWKFSSFYIVFLLILGLFTGRIRFYTFISSSRVFTNSLL
jgi:hypothetical protein